MLIRSVIRHEIQDELEPALVRRCNQAVEIGQRAEDRIDVAIIATSYPKSAIGEG